MKKFKDSGTVGFSEEVDDKKTKKINVIPENNHKNFGLIRPEYMGAMASLYKDILFLPKIVDGSKDWMTFSSEREIQRTAFIDLMDCTIESPINVYHIYMDLLNGWKLPINSPVFPTSNLSQRFNATMAGITQNGGTTNNADNSLINYGVCDESFWHRTQDMNWNQYYAPIPTSVKQQAKKSLNSWQYTPYLISPDHQTMMDALDRGLICATGYAWELGDDGLYHDFGYSPNHRFVIAGYVKGVKWLIRDSYPTDMQLDPNTTEQEFFKELAWGFRFGECKLITISPVADKGNLFLALLNKIKMFFFNLNSMMLKKIKMMVPGGAKFLFKEIDGVLHKQEIKTANDILAAFVDEFGCQGITPEDAAKIPDTDTFLSNT